MKRRSVVKGAAPKHRRYDAKHDMARRFCPSIIKVDAELQLMIDASHVSWTQSMVPSAWTPTRDEFNASRGSTRCFGA